MLDPKIDGFSMFIITEFTLLVKTGESIYISQDAFSEGVLGLRDDPTCPKLGHQKMTKIRVKQYSRRYGRMIYQLRRVVIIV